MCRPSLARPVTLASTALAFLLAGTGLVAAHPGIGTKFDAPLPLPLLFAGAGLTVAATAGYLAVGEREVRTGERALGRLGPGTGRALRTLGAGGFLVLFVTALADGAFGRQIQLENIATVFIWPLWLKGVALVSVLAGSPWRVLSPWHTLYRGLCRLEGDTVALREYPAWLGAWPALLGVLALGFVENLTVLPRDPLLTAALLASYALAMLLGGVAFGPTWFDRADTLAVLYRLFGRVRVLDVERTDRGGYALSLRPPWRGTLAPVPPAEAAVVVLAVFTVSFDGFRETPEFQSVAGVFRETFGPGLGAALPVYGLGAVLFLVVFVAATWLTATLLNADPGRTTGRLAPTVLPIAAAYEVAHNVDYLLVNAGQFGTLVAGRVGLSLSVDPTAWLSLPVYWGLQIALVVLGHVVAVVAAHAVLRRGAIGRRDTGGTVGRAHVPLTLVMVAYTLVSLFVISRPVVA